MAFGGKFARKEGKSIPWIGAAASIAGGAISGLFGSKSAKSAQSAQENAAQQALAAQREALIASNRAREDATSTARAEMQPFRDTGVQANLRLRDLLGLGAPTRAQVADEFLQQHLNTFGRGYGMTSDMGAENAAIDKAYQDRLAEWNANPNAGPSAESIMAMDPGYQFRLGEGEKAINRAASSRGGYDSGATLKALSRYGQDYASNEFGNVFQRLLATSGTGQGAANTNANAAVMSGNGMANSLMQAGQNNANLWTGLGNAQGASEIAQGNAWGGLFNNAGQTISNALTFNDLMKQLGGAGRGTTTVPYGGNSWASGGGFNPFN